MPQKTIHESFKEIFENAQNHKLPRFSELPEIDLYMDQIIVIMEKYLSIYSQVFEGKIITPAIINNYVKLKIIPAPVMKKYSKVHIAYLIVICLLKQTLPIKSIVDMINLGLEQTEIGTLYDTFCDFYEMTIKDASIKALKKVEVEQQQLYSAYSELTISSAVSSTVGRFICENILKLNEK